jgi:hypothetical protein
VGSKSSIVTGRAYPSAKQTTGAVVLVGGAHPCTPLFAFSCPDCPGDAPPPHSQTCVTLQQGEGETGKGPSPPVSHEEGSAGPFPALPAEPLPSGIARRPKPGLPLYMLWYTAGPCLVPGMLTALWLTLARPSLPAPVLAIPSRVPSFRRVTHPIPTPAPPERDGRSGSGRKGRPPPGYPSHHPTGPRVDRSPRLPEASGSVTGVHRPATAVETVGGGQPPPRHVSRTVIT